MTLRAILREALAQRLARGESRAFAKAEMRGLPMDEASRMARASEMGFDVETPLYHGTGRDFDRFDVNAPETTLGSGNNDAIYLTNRPDHASAYAETMAHRLNIDPDWAPRVLPVMARDERPLLVSDEVYGWLKQNEAARSGRARMNRYADERGRRAWEQLFPGEPMPEGSLLQAIRDRGYSSLRTSSGEEVAIFDPSNIRSRFAAFDPHNTNRANLLGSFAIGAPIGALTLREALRERTGA